MKKQDFFSNENNADAFINQVISKEQFNDESEAERFVEAIRYCRVQSKRNLRTLGNTLESNIKTVFDSTDKYIYELLQNADDVKASDVEITIKGRTLYFSHSGMHFRPVDVEKICDNAQPSGNKSDDINKIGYKGVGFKATFCISNRITVVSEPACFRFDKEVFANQAFAYPWQIIPFWTDKTTLHFPSLENSSAKRVHFILENIDSLRIEKELLQLFGSLEVLLLLKNVSQVKLTHQAVQICRERNGNYILLKKMLNGECIAEKTYLLYENSVDIPEEERKALQNLSASECPEKLKNAEQVKIVFALELNKHQKPIPATEAKLFSYLPTEVKTKFPFWVNAEFLLSQDRGRLLNRQWNHFLMKQIGRLHFEVLRRIAQDERLKYNVIALIPNEQLTSDFSQPFNDAYTQGFNEGKEQVEFIPAATQGDLLKLSQCHADSCGFFVSAKELAPFLKTEKTKALFPNLFSENKEFLAHPHLEDLNKLQKLIVGRVYSLSKVIDKLNEYVHLIYPANKEAFRELLRYFVTIESADDLENLSKIKWIPTSKQEFQFPGKCFLGKKVLGDVYLKLKLDLIDEEVLPQDDERERVQNWLHQHFDAPEVDNLNIVRVHFMKLFEEERAGKHTLSEGNTVWLLNFTYRTYCDNKANMQIGHVLNELGAVFTLYMNDRRTRLPLNQCIMPDELFYGTNQLNMLYKIQNKVPGKYFKANTDDEKESFRAFFLSLGIKAELRLNFSVPAVKKIDPIKFQAPLLSGYKNFCQNQLPLVQMLFETKEHKIENLITCDFINKINLPGYDEIFWNLVSEHFNKITPCIYHTPNSKIHQKYEIPPFIIYYVQEQKCIRVKNSDSLGKATELYAPMVAEKFFECPLTNVAFLPVNLDLRILEVFGFKTELSVVDALALLANPLYQKVPDDVARLYRCLLAVYQEKDEPHVRQFVASYPMLSAASTLEKVNAPLLWDDKQDDHLPSDNLFLHPCGLSWDEMKKITKIFSIDAFSLQKGHNTFRHKQMSDTKKSQLICSKLRTKVQGFLHIATLDRAERSGISEVEGILNIARDYLEELKQLSLICCEELKYVDSSLKAELPFNVFNGKIYFTEAACNPANSTNLHKAIANKMFPDSKERFSRGTPAIRGLFKDYMDDAFKIERSERRYSKVFSQCFDEVKDFFVAALHHNSLSDKTEQSSDLIPIEAPVTSTPHSSPAKLKQAHETQPSPIPERTAANSLEELFSDISVSEETADNNSEEHESAGFSDSSIELSFIKTPPKINDKTTRMRTGKNTRSTMSQQERNEIGFFGERAVYKKLIKHYEEKYEITQENKKELPQGIVLENAKHKEKNFIRTITITWPDKLYQPDSTEKKSTTPYDIMVVKSDKQQAPQVIEVKSTKSTEPGETPISISAGEWNTMRQYGKKCRLFRVTQATEKNPTIFLPIKDPAKVINDGLLDGSVAVDKITCFIGKN